MGDDKAEWLRSWFDQIESQVQFGDNKAALLVAGDAILLAACGGLIGVVSGCPQNDVGVGCLMPSVPLGLATMAAACLVVSLTCALFAARPNRIHDAPPAELFLPSYIAAMDRHAFVKACKEASSDDLADAALAAIHGKARYATEKFRWLRRAVNATLLSVGFIVATLVVAIGSRMLR